MEKYEFLHKGDISMKKLLSALLLLILLLPQPVLADDDSDMTTLEVSAQSDVKAAPDMATVSAGVMTSSATADAAMKANATSMTAVFAALKKAGIAEKDIQSAGISVNPQYHYGQNEAPRITGYQANNTVNVVLRDLGNIGPVLDALVEQGANQLNGPMFGIENTAPLLDKARAEAVKKARARAEIYAAAAGLKVKRIISIAENVGYAVPPPMPMMKAMAMDAAQASTPVAPGEVGLSATVNVKFELTQ